MAKQDKKPYCFGNYSCCSRDTDCHFTQACIKQLENNNVEYERSHHESRGRTWH